TFMTASNPSLAWAATLVRRPAAARLESDLELHVPPDPWPPRGALYRLLAVLIALWFSGVYDLSRQRSRYGVGADQREVAACPHQRGGRRGATGEPAARRRSVRHCHR